MRDPLEGVATDGTITTGAHPDRIVAEFRPILDLATERVEASGGTLYLYGSVATGTARLEVSDVDLIALDVPADDGAAMARELSAEFAEICRGVEIGVGRSGDYELDDDEAYGNRVFLRHYCVHLVGPPLAQREQGYPADARAARGFNGDLGIHVAKWRQSLDTGADGAPLGRRVARKTLLAVAGLVSIHDNTWTTDRLTAAQRWSEIRTDLADGLGELMSWADEEESPSADAVRIAVEDTVSEVVADFASTIGLWR